MSLVDAIKRDALELGFDAVGIAAVSVPPRPDSVVSRLRTWLQRGYHGTMAWMSRRPERRGNPDLVLPGCRSIVSVGINYNTGDRAVEGPGYGRIARYAWGADYHDVLGPRLKELEARIQARVPEAHTRSYVDTGPVMEKYWAQQAGLGWIGKHSNLVSPDFGSWLLLGEVLTTLDLPPDLPGSDLCGSCSLCIQACPTDAIPEAYVVDATRCISYLTIEFRGPREDIPERLSEQMGRHLFGCDDCLDICPFNLRGDPTSEPAFVPTETTKAPRLSVLQSLDEGAFQEAFRRSPIRRAKYEGFQRNLAIARRNDEALRTSSSFTLPSLDQEE